MNSNFPILLQAFDLLSDQDARNIYDAQSGPPSGQADADADDAIAGDAGKERHEVDSWARDTRSVRPKVGEKN